MNLQEYIQSRCLELDLSYPATMDLFSSRNRFGRVMTLPGNASLDEVLALSERLEVPPITLVRKWEMGTSVLSERVVGLLDQLQDLTHKNAIPQNTITKHNRKAAQGRCAGSCQYNPSEAVLSAER